jgi:hypothetical protein
VVVVAPLVRSLVSRALRVAIALGAKLTPRRMRMRYAWLVARLIRPIVARGFRDYRILTLLNSELSLSLGYVLRAMTEHGCEFDLPMRVHGEIPEDGAFIAGGHQQLNIAGVRLLFDRGRRIRLVRPTTDEHLMVGTRVPLELLASRDVMLFVRMRNALRAGETVVAMIDRLEGDGFAIQQEALSVALRSGVPIAFLAARVGDDGVIDVWFASPKATDAVAIAKELHAFVWSAAAMPPLCL